MLFKVRERESTQIPKTERKMNQLILMSEQIIASATQENLPSFVKHEQGVYFLKCVVVSKLLIFKVVL